MIEFEFEQTKGNWNEILLYSLNKSPWYTLEKNQSFSKFLETWKIIFICVYVCVGGGEWMIPGEHGQSNQLSRAHMSSQN